MESSAPSADTIRFRVFVLDARWGKLGKQGVRIRLQDQPLLILKALLERPGEIVTREELRARIWPADTFVDFDHGLYSAMKRLRDALGDSADNPRFIETLSRRGYRFIAPVTGAHEVTQASVSPQVLVVPSATEARTETPPPRLARRMALVGLGVLVGSAALVVALKVGGLQSWIWGNISARPPRSLAVLPLANLSSDPAQEYFADEMTEELITQFSKLGDLKVI